MRGNPDAGFGVDPKLGFSAGGALDEGPKHQARGTHGYSSTHPGMRATFFMSGDRISNKGALGEIDTAALLRPSRSLGIPFPTADQPAPPVEQ